MRIFPKLFQKVVSNYLTLTVVCKAKKMRHRVHDYLEARLAYTAAMFNVLLTLFHQLHPDADPAKLSIAEFSL